MGDIKLFKVENATVQELEGESFRLEKQLQTLIESHLEAFLSIRFLATEYSTGTTHGGRIDSLGLDENYCPVIIEYKRETGETVITQGLYYLDWLYDHKAEYVSLVAEKLNLEESKKVEWSAPRLICIAGEFTKYDEHAIQQINRNIELIRYKKFDENLILFDLVNARTAEPVEVKSQTEDRSTDRTVSEVLESAHEELKNRFEDLKAYILGLGEDVQMRTVKYYFAFKRIRNFACVEFRTQNNNILMYLKVEPLTIELETGFTRDVTNIGHFGTGNLEVSIKSDEELEKAKNLLVQSYEAS